MGHGTARSDGLREVARAGMSRRPRGMSLIGILAILVLVVTVVTLVLKCVPHYIDFYTMDSIVAGLPASEVRSATRTSLSDTLKKRFKINNLRDFEIRDIITLDRSREVTALEVNYERREHLFYNVDVVLTFHKRYEYGT